MDKFLQASQPYVILVKDLITIASLIAASVIAGMGLYTWKKQLVGTTEYELAKRILKATYRLRDTLENVRNPLIYAGEQNQAMKEANLELDSNAPDNERKRSIAVYGLRWKGVVSNLQDLQLEAIEAEAVWGTDVKKQILGIQHNVIELFSAIQMYHIYAFKPRRGEREIEVIEKFEKIIYTVPGEQVDEYSSKLLAEVNKIESLVKPYLKRNHR